MRKWKKFMAAALAFSMAVPSCMPQTLWAAEFSAEESMDAVQENFADGNANENADANTNAIMNTDRLDENSADKVDSEDEEQFAEPEFGTGEAEITDGEDKTDVTADEKQEEPDSLELVEAGQATEGYVIQLYSNNKLEKTYMIPFAEAEKAKAPAALTGRNGYIFKEWNTDANGKGTSYKPGDSLKELLEESNINTQEQNVKTAQISGRPEENANESLNENVNENAEGLYQYL